jgi:hypothetical protein
MQRKLSGAAAEMPVRDQPMVSAMGWRKIPSEEHGAHSDAVDDDAATITHP